MWLLKISNRCIEKRGWEILIYDILQKKKKKNKKKKVEINTIGRGEFTVNCKNSLDKKKLRSSTKKITIKVFRTRNNTKRKFTLKPHTDIISTLIFHADFFHVINDSILLYLQQTVVNLS